MQNIQRGKHIRKLTAGMKCPLARVLTLNRHKLRDLLAVAVVFDLVLRVALQAASAMRMHRSGHTKR